MREDLGPTFEKIRGAEVARRLKHSRCGASALGVREGENHHEQSSSGKGASRSQGDQQDNRRCECGDPTAPPKGSLAGMGGLRVDMEEMSSATTNGM